MEPSPQHFAVYIASYSPTPADHGVRRDWYVRFSAGGEPVLDRNFERARQMTLAEAVEIYRRIDSPVRKLGMVPLED